MPVHWPASFSRNLLRVADPSKLKRALGMLLAQSFQLFAEVRPGRIVGVVRSQSASKRVYACRLTEDGRYACCSQDLITCDVSRDSPCKHLLVLVLSLVNAGRIAPSDALDWLGRSRGRDRRLDMDEMAAIFLLYKAAEAGRVDWRPTETIPEDFYAM
jgi:hypothetical protein